MKRQHQDSQTDPSATTFVSDTRAVPSTMRPGTSYPENWIDMDGWRGGKIMTQVNINTRQDAYIVEIGTIHGRVRKCFSWPPNAMDRACEYAAATDFLRKTAKANGLVKNQYRLCTSSTGSNYIEMKLTRGYIVRLDVEDLQRVQDEPWRARVTPTVVYAQGSSGRMMHNIITGFPFVDHIDHDGLNNQRDNLRSATYLINSRNTRRVPKGAIGVLGIQRIVKKNREYFQASWLDDGKNVRRSFNIAKHGEAEALRLATETRRAAEKRLGFSYQHAD